MKQLVLIGLLIIAAAIVTAQNPRMSMFNASPLVVNPALAGNFEGTARVSVHGGIYRNEGAYINHLNAGADFRIKLKPSKKEYNRLGIGLNFYTYGFNSRSPLQASFPSLSVAFQSQLGKSGKHFIGVGGQLAYATASLDESRGIYNKEISGGGFRYEPTVLRNQTASNSYTNASGGITYTYKGEEAKFEMGVSLFHFIYSRNDIYKRDRETRLRRRGVFTGRFEFKAGHKTAIALQTMYWADGLYLRSTTLDSDNLVAFFNGVELLNTKPLKKVYLNGGLYSRNMRTLMPYGSLNLTTQWNLRASYEWPFNSTAFTAYRAHRGEVALIMILNKKNKR